MLGKRLVELRRRKKLTQHQIADLLHISRSTYAQYEVDRRVPEYGTLEKMADLFGVSIDYLVGRTNDSNVKSENVKSPNNLLDPAVVEKIIHILAGKTKEEQEYFLELLKRLSK